MIDFHTHILPEIDDGSSSAKESLALLKMLKKQGVNSVFLTPHFYAYSSSAENFCEMQEKALKELIKELKEDSIDIDLYLGCEVFFFDELWRIENLRDFCIKGTDYILLEMPFAEWTDAMVRSIEKIIGKGYTPIIAHFERYLKHKSNLSKIYELIEMGALLQMNCKYLTGFFTRGRAIKFIKRGMVAALGTDCHNLSDRAPDYIEASCYLKKKLSEEQYKRFIRTQKRLVSKCRKVYPI